MIVEFLGLPGSGKSTLVSTLRKQSARSDMPLMTLNQAALAGLAVQKEAVSYLRRKPERGWLFATMQFAKQHPELYRIVFENTLLNAGKSLDFLDVLGKYYFAGHAPEPRGPVLCDEGLLHRGAAQFVYANAHATLDHYLDHMSVSEIVVHLMLPPQEAIARCKARKKGLPALYRALSDAELFARYRLLDDLHGQCLTHQAHAGAQIVALDARAPVADLVTQLQEAIALAARAGASGGDI